MTTKNFYESDTVGATLVDSILANNRGKAFATARELYVSEEYELLTKLLVFTWCLEPTTHPKLYSIYKAFCNSDFAQMLYLLCHPSKLPEIPIVSPLKPPKLSSEPFQEWKILPRGWSPSIAASLRKAVADAIRHKNAHRAYILTSYLLATDSDAVVSLLESFGLHIRFLELFSSVMFSPQSLRLLMHAYAILCVSDEAKILQDPVCDSRYTTLHQTVVGRDARTFKIENSVLSNWHIRPKSIKRLQDAPVCIIESETTAVWSKLVDKFGIYVSDGSLISKNDDDLDSFYLMGFPDDIPDEWSIEERQKSHPPMLDAQTFPINPWIPGFILCWS